MQKLHISTVGSRRKKQLQEIQKMEKATNFSTIVENRHGTDTVVHHQSVSHEKGIILTDSHYVLT